jgi:pyruvate kinase
MNQDEKIMVTLPSAREATDDWIKRVLIAGSNLIRINCAHES